jgi:hypothetical protein
MNRQKFNRRDANRLDVVDDRFDAQSRIGPPEFFRNVWMLFSKALYVGFVDDGAVPGNGLSFGFAFPIKRGIDNNAFWHKRRAVSLVECQVVA